MRHHILKFIVGTALGLAVALLVAFNALLLWVATGPRSLDRLSPYIAASFQTPDHAYSVKIAQTWLIWDGWKHPIDIRLKNVTVLTKEGQIFSAFPEISLGIDVLSLARGRILPTSLTITHPVISLFQNEDRSISFGFRQENPAAPPPADTAAAPADVPATENMPATVPFATVLAPLIAPDEQGSLRKLRFITILDADVSVASARKGVFFKAGDATIVFKRNRQGVIQAAINAKISYDVNQSLVDAQFTFTKKNPIIEGEVSFSQLMPGTLAALFSDNNALAAAKLPLSGKSKLSLDMNGTLQRLNFVVDGGEGSIESDRLEAPLAVRTLHVEGQLSNNASDIQIDHLTADLDGAELAADGVVSLSNGDVAVRANCALKNVAAADVHLFWPPGLSPQSRAWVVGNISEGNVPQAEAHFNIAFGDLAKPLLPKEDIDAAITLEDAKIRYLPDHPEVSHVKGVIHVNAVSLEADIGSGDYMKETRLSNGKLLIDDLNADNPYIKVSFDAESSARDVVRLLGLPRLKHAARLNLHEESVVGSVKGTASLRFNFFAAHDEKGRAAEPDIAYDIAADLKGVAAPGFMQKFDIKNGDGKLTVDNKVIEFKGSGDVNGASVSNADVKYLFRPDKNFDTFIDIAATTPVEALPRFGYPQFPFLKGTLGIKASLKEGDAVEQSQAAIDLTNAVVTLPDFGWNKADKEAASLNITAEKKDGMVSLPSFDLKGKDMAAHGSAELNADLSDFKRVDMDKLRYGNTDLDNLVYEPIEGGWHIEAHGNSADIAAWLGNDRADDEHSFSFEHFPALELKADIGRVILGKAREVSAVKGEVSCDAELCGSATIGGKTADGKPFSFRILRNPKAVRQLSLHAQGAGAFLKAAGIFDGMEGGDLTIIGNYDDSGATSVLKGKGDVSEYTVHDAPILAKILSLASLTGFFDTLVGKGIHFDRLSAPFTLSKDVITLDNAKTHGDAIGMTIEGTITFPKRTLDLKGTVIPSYTLNSMLGKVPLVGSILTGGKGQGVFAARYSVEGSVKQPDVSVNPLAILTPGFLRGVFDIFDMPEKKGEETQ